MLLLENCKIMVVLVVGTEKKFEMKMGVFHGLLTDFNLKDQGDHKVLYFAMNSMFDVTFIKEWF